jgi:acetyl esterase/lipase
MKIEESAEAVRDYWRFNRYALQSYLLKDNKNHPFVLVIPGGGYQMVCSFAEGLPVARYLNQKGFHAFVLYYHTRCRGEFHRPVDDVARAVRDIRKNAGENHVLFDHYAICGFSAGAHLAGLFASKAWGYSHYSLTGPEYLILGYPVVSMTVSAHPGSRNNLLGKNADEEKAAGVSIENLVTPDFPGTFLWYGNQDKTVDPVNSRLLYEALRRNNVPCQLEVYGGVKHGVGLAEDSIGEGWMDQAISFWQNNN